MHTYMHTYPAHSYTQTQTQTRTNTHQGIITLSQDAVNRSLQGVLLAPNL